MRVDWMQFLDRVVSRRLTPFGGGNSGEFRVVFDQECSLGFLACLTTSATTLARFGAD